MPNKKRLWSEESAHPPKVYRIRVNPDGTLEREQVIYLDNIPGRRMLMLFPGSAEGANKDASADNLVQSINRLTKHYDMDMSNVDIYTCSYYHPYPSARTDENIKGLISRPLSYISEDALVIARSLLPLIASNYGYDRSRFYGDKISIKTVKENLSRLTCFGKSKGGLIATREIFHAIRHLMYQEYGYKKEEINDCKPEMLGIGLGNLFTADLPTKQSYGILFTDGNDKKARKYHPNFKQLVEDVIPREGIRVTYLSNEHTALCVSNIPAEQTLITPDGGTEQFKDDSGHKVKHYIGLRANEAENEVPRAVASALKFSLTRTVGKLKRIGLPKVMDKIIEQAPTLTKSAEKVLIWGESLVGSGHLNYMASVAKELAERGYEVQIVTGSRTSKMPDMKIPGVKIIDLPAATGNYDTNKIITENNKPIAEDTQWQQEYKSRLEGVISDFKPTVMITEFWPIRRGDYDFAMDSVISYKQQTPDTKLFALIRDYVPMSVEVTRHNGDDQKSANIIGAHYDKVIVHSVERLLPLSHSFTATDQIKDQVEYVGYLMPKRAKIQGKPPVRDKVIVTTGGTWVNYCEDTYDAVIKTIKESKLKNDEVIILLPPNTPEAEAKKIEHKVAAAGIKAKPQVNTDDFSELLLETKALFCHGGNTMVEAIDAGVKQIYVTPRMEEGQISVEYGRHGARYTVGDNVFREQLVRAAVFANAGYVCLMRPEDLKDMPAIVNDYQEHSRFHLSISTQELSDGARGAANVVDSIARPKSRADIEKK